MVKLSPIGLMVLMTANKQVILGLALPQRIIAVLGEAGVEVRFCGGVVRDMLLDSTIMPVDVDMASPLPPEDAMACLEAAGLRVIPSGIGHGTITALDPAAPDIKVELTTLRKDITTDGRHAEVCYVDDWQIDASRRDFTFNSLYMTASGAVIDFFDGCADLEAGRVRFIGDAGARIAEDYLRVLRYFRFYTRFGGDAPDAETAEALRDGARHLDGLSGERVGGELRKILASGDVRTLGLMRELGVLDAIYAGDWDVEAYGVWAGVDDARAPMLALAVMLRAGGEVVEELSVRLKLSRNECRDLQHFATPLEAEEVAGLLGDAWRVYVWRRCRRWRWTQEQVAGAWLISQLGAPINTARLQAIRAYVLARLPINGDDVQALGVRGAAVGAMLEQVEDYWLECGFSASRAELLAQLKELADG